MMQVRQQVEAKIDVGYDERTKGPFTAVIERYLTRLVTIRCRQERQRRDFSTVKELRAITYTMYAVQHLEAINGL
jgi:hypothetical protein